MGIATIGVSKRFSDVAACDDVSIDVAEGSLTALLGPSGCGKSTLLRIVAGLEQPDSGRVLFDGQSIHELPDAERTRHRAGTMGFIFQAFNLIPVFTTTENVELPLLLSGTPEREALAPVERSVHTQPAASYKVGRRSFLLRAHKNLPIGAPAAVARFKRRPAPAPCVRG